MKMMYLLPLIVTGGIAGMAGLISAAMYFFGTIGGMFAWALVICSVIGYIIDKNKL